MNTFEPPRGTNLDRARQIFSEITDTADLLSAFERQDHPKRLAASSLYAAAKNGTEIPATVAGIRAARVVYHRVVADTAQYTAPEARAAASSTQTLERHGEDCRIHVERSRAEPTQFYVVIELLGKSHKADPPTSLLVCDSQDRCQRFPLPPVRDGISQVITDVDSELMRLISDPTTRVYLT